MDIWLWVWNLCLLFSCCTCAPNNHISVITFCIGICLYRPCLVFAGMFSLEIESFPRSACRGPVAPDATRRDVLTRRVVSSAPGPTRRSRSSSIESRNGSRVQTFTTDAPLANDHDHKRYYVIIQLLAHPRLRLVQVSLHLNYTGTDRHLLMRAILDLSAQGAEGEKL